MTDDRPSTHDEMMTNQNTRSPMNRTDSTRTDSQRSRGRRFVNDSRAASEVLGTVLLVGMVAIGMVVIALAGGTALEGLTTQGNQEVTQLSIQGIDSRLSGLAHGGENSTRISVQQGTVQRVELVNATGGGGGGGQIRVSANGGTCAVTVPLTSIRYHERGQTTVYEAGGVFRQSDGENGTAVVSAPDFTIDDGTVGITVVNLTGRFASDSAVIEKRTAFSRQQTETIEKQLFTGTDECRRPSSLTISVTSDYYRGWATHLASETDASVQTFDSNRTVVLHLDSGDLPPSVNDDVNDVVDLQNTSVATVTDDTVKIDKNASNDYRVFARPLAQGVRVSRIESFETDIAYREPVDVVFVIDESGSMSTDDKIGDARSEAKTFTGRLNASFDRAGLVGFNTEGRIYTTNGRYLTDDFAGFNDTVEDEITAGGGTSAGDGLERANIVLDFAGETDREKAVILLADGAENDGGPDYIHPYDQADIAAQSNVNVYTIGYNQDPDEYNETLLREIANRTGGTFHRASNADELEEAFEDIFESISQTDAIVNEPVTLSTQVGAATFDTSLGADTDYVARAGSNPNVNDPTAPGFSFSMSASDGDVTNITATQYGCDEYEATGIVQSNATTGDRIEIRCVDINESTATTLPPSNKSIYLDGDSVAPLLTQPSAWWEADLRNETFRANEPDSLINGSDHLILQSNQALVVFEFGSNSQGKKRLIMLYEIGVSDGVAATEVVDIRVVTADVVDS
jgi:Mg-chelatase subunit ChlD/FlaG/FlaF family flagellin (archaellin)